VFGESQDSNAVYNTGVTGEGGLALGNNYGGYFIGEGGTGNGYTLGIYAETVGSDSAGAYAGYFGGNAATSGDLDVGGTLTKAAGTFKIDHPQDPANKYLIHSFVESPDMMNIYNGIIVTDANGKATVQLPSYFEAENINFKYQLTCIGQFAQAIVSQEIANNQFVIATDKPNVKVSWEVTGVRNDLYAQKTPDCC